MAEQVLTLQEQALLLCLHPRTGEIEARHFRYLLSGAALAELLRQKRISLDMGRVQVRQTQLLGDRAIDDAFLRFGVTVRPRRLKWWVRNLYGSVSAPFTILAERLTERGILTAQEHRALWVIRWTRYPVLEPAYTQRLQRQIRNIILSGVPPTEEQAILISLLHNGKALDRVLSQAEMVNYEQRIAQVVAGDPNGYAVGKAIADALLQDEQQYQHGHHGRPVIIVTPPRHRHPRRPRPDWHTTFPGERPGHRHGVWTVEDEEESPSPA